MHRGAEADSVWIPLPCDLAPGQQTSLEIALRGAAAAEIRLYHALDGIESVALEPFQVERAVT